MNRLAWTYLLLLLTPALALAFFALRVADQDYIEGTEARRRALDVTAETLAERVEAALTEATGRADATLEQVRQAIDSGEPLETEDVVGFARGGEWLGYGVPGRVDGSEEPFSDRDLELYRLSSRGGEHYELVENDPELALDAYAFYLPRIESRALRDRLRFRTARAALAAGREGLGRRLLEQLMSETSSSEEGLPLDVVAALRLLETAESGSPSPNATRLLTAALDHFRRRRHTVPTDLLRYVASRTPLKDPLLIRWIERRKTFEDSLQHHPELLTDQDTLLIGDRLLLARHPGDGFPADVRAIVQLEVVLPPLVAGPDLVARLDVRPPLTGHVEPREPGGPPAKLDVARSDVRIGEGSPVLASVEVTDSRMEEILDGLRGRRNLQRALIGLLVTVTLAGGFALLYYLRRERKLARLRTQLLANVSHELKTPATSIRMLSEMLAKEDLGEAKSKRFADLLHGESLRLGRIIENVLEFSRLERGRRAFTPEDVDLRRVVRRVFESFSYRTREQEITLREEGAHLENGPPIEMASNENAIECILFNLLDNAVKYSTVKKGDSAAPGFRPEVILKIDLDRERSAVQISVTDNGVGVRAEDRERIFEEFYRARFEDYGVQGTGLGLSISRALARRLGGDITVESAPERGSTFVLTLPLPSRGGAETAESTRDSTSPIRSCPDPSSSNERSNAALAAPSPRSTGRKPP